MTAVRTGGDRPAYGRRAMAADTSGTSGKRPNDQQLSREEFDRLAELLGVGGDPAYLDELYSQVRGVFIGANAVREIDVSGSEPDMAFIPKVT